MDIVRLTDQEREMFQAHFGIMHQVFNRYANRKEYLDPDCLQYVRLVVCKMIPRWEPKKSKIVTYIGLSTKWALGDWRRRKGWKDQARTATCPFTVGHNDKDDFDNMVPTVEHPEIDFLEIEKLRSAMQRLNNRDREILTMMFFEDCSLSQVGSRFKITKERVRQLANRAKDNLRKKMEAIDAGRH